jgi:sulfatase maturation enzyme AslB (radical SAM superfamily)
MLSVLGRHFLPNPRNTIRVGNSGVCNLSCKFCIYSKTEHDKGIMPMNMFQKIIEQTANMGFSSINLTPIRGEVFMDKSILKKMQYLDNHPQIKRYHFFSNFVVPSEQTIQELFQLRKLDTLKLSIYGHDEQSFCNLTRGTKKEYHRLVKNLKSLYELYSQNRPFKLNLLGRTVPGFSGKLLFSELQEILLNLSKIQSVIYDNIFLYHDYGGQITNEDIKDLGLRIKNGSNVYKKGLCSTLFRWASVLEDGRVSACGCDSGIDDSLIIGDINKKPLSYILSLKNSLYADIIQEQIEGKFRPICKGCTSYHSIYKSMGWKNYNLNQVKTLLC